MVDVFDGLRLEKKELESRLKVVNRLLTSKDVKVYIEYEKEFERSNFNVQPYEDIVDDKEEETQS